MKLLKSRILASFLSVASIFSIQIPVQADSVKREIYFKNKCSEPIKLVLRYRNPYAEWKTRGWWNFDSSEGAYLNLNGHRIYSDNSIFYYYAYIPGTNYSWSGDEEREFGGREYPMRKYKLSLNSDGDWYLSLSCPNRISNASIVPNVALIKSPINDRVLDFRNSDRNREPIKLVDEHRGRSQQWRLVPLNNGFYLIKSVVNGRVLDFRNSDRNGEPVKLVNEHRGDSQQWKLEQLSNGRFIIVSKVNGRVLDFRNSDRNREPVKLVNRHGGASQQWILEGL